MATLASVVEQDADAQIALRGVAMRYGEGNVSVLALDRTDLLIRRGEFLVLLGPSGCGKTTLLRMIAGLVRPSEGDIGIAGQPLWTQGRRNAQALSQLGVVFQDAQLFPWLNIESNIALPLKLAGYDREQRLAKARELCELVGISGFERVWPRQLSGGMRQRAAIARALAADPSILLMDEPFGALDAMTRDQMNLELQRIWLARPSTVVFVTHSISEAVFLADRVLLLSPRPGRIDMALSVEFPRPRPMRCQDDPAFQSIVRALRERLEHTR